MHCRGIGVLALSAFALAGCPEEEFVQLAPRIQVDACKSDGIDSCLVDFETVALSTRASREILISNPSNVVLELTEPTFSTASDPAFRVEHWPDRVGEGLSSKMVVSFRPMVETEVLGTLLIHSNAVNVDGDEPLAVELRGQGIDNGLPQIEIVASSPCVGTFPGSTDPADLGITGVGHPAACTFEIFNRGTKDLVVEQITFVEDETDFGFEFVGRVPGTDPETGERFESVIPPPEPGETSSRAFVARGAPPGLGIFSALILIESNDPGCASATSPCPEADQRTRVRVPVQIEGAHTPNAVAAVYSVNGDTNFDIRRIEPLDDVMLTAEDSAASSRSLRITDYQWEIINQPVGSHGFLDDPSAITPRFMFNNSNNVIPGVDIAGFWEVRLTVVDSRGATSVNEAVVSFNAIPTEAIHVQLVWDHPNSDVNLHLLRELPGGGFESFGDDDCYFGNCKVASGNLEWFAEEEANPFLDVDDLYGYGPENINIKTPHAGKFKVAVHYWSDHGEGNTVAVLRLFLFGNLHSEYIAELTSSDWWEVATIEWPSRAVETIDTIEPDVSGF